MSNQIFNPLDMWRETEVHYSVQCKQTTTVHCVCVYTKRPCTNLQILFNAREVYHQMYTMYILCTEKSGLFTPLYTIHLQVIIHKMVNLQISWMHIILMYRYTLNFTVLTVMYCVLYRTVYFL